jgi:hypothetical protein
MAALPLVDASRLPSGGRSTREAVDAPGLAAVADEKREIAGNGLITVGVAVRRWKAPSGEECDAGDAAGSRVVHKFGIKFTNLDKYFIGR